MIIYLGGVPGVGKTFLTKHVERLATTENFPLKRLVGIGILCELAGVPTPEALRLLPEETRRKFRPEMYRRIYEEDRRDINTIRLGDGHFCMFEVKTDRFGVREIQPWDKDQVLGIIVITAHPEAIMERRRQDKGVRQDRRLDISFIRHEQEKELMVASQQASQLQVPLATYDNSLNDDFMALSREILALIKDWRKDWMIRTFGA